MSPRPLAVHFGNRMKVPECLSKMTRDGLLGARTTVDFIFTKREEAKPNPQVSAYVQSQKAREMTREELQERMVFLVVNEAARCLEEQIVTDPADVDFAMIMGTGFAPFRGGPLRYADTVGATRLVGAMNHLVASGTAHFEPCKLLAGMAASGVKSFIQKIDQDMFSKLEKALSAARERIRFRSAPVPGRSNVRAWTQFASSPPAGCQTIAAAGTAALRI